MRRIEEKFPSLQARIAMMKEPGFNWSNFYTWLTITSIAIVECVLVLNFLTKDLSKSVATVGLFFLIFVLVELAFMPRAEPRR